jgi:hypothetical protein
MVSSATSPGPARDLGQRHAAVARAHLAVGEDRLGGVEAQLLRHGSRSFTQAA